MSTPGRCEHCTHWMPFSARNLSHKKYGECAAADIYRPGRDYGIVPITGIFVIDQNDDPYIGGRLITRPSFGCTEFRDKEENG